MAEYIEREDTINSKPEGRNPEQSGKEEYNKGWNDCRRYFVRIIESQPAADVAPVVHGRWIKRKHGLRKIFYHCSHCHFGLSKTGDDDYCNCCGAKMDGEETHDR